ncbi:acyl-CoA thioesterase [Rickettsiales bacterium LUAb2]
MYSQKTVVKAEHIDFQGIVDGLYYPHYMEKVRHDFMRDVYNVDIIKAAEKGDLYVLVSYEMRFKHSLQMGDDIEVTCEVKPLSSIKFGFHQKIIANNKVCAEADFVATCMPKGGGRPFIPTELKTVLEKLQNS